MLIILAIISILIILVIAYNYGFLAFADPYINSVTPYVEPYWKTVKESTIGIYAGKFAGDVRRYFVGAKGDKGDKGDRGEKGDKGDRGIQGPIGLTGPAGKDGTNGKDGINGINGKDGLPGAAGKNGTNGERGPAGSNGTNGLPGAQGIPGSVGPMGPPGIGLPGPPGIPGSVGPKGADAVIPADPRFNSVGRDVGDWFRIYGTAANGTAIYNGVSINDNGGLNVGRWGKVPTGMVASNEVAANDKICIGPRYCIVSGPDGRLDIVEGNGATTGPGLYTYRPNFDKAGNDIKQFTGTFAECKAECQRLTDCAGFNRPTTSKDSDRTTCWIKNQNSRNATGTVGNDWNHFEKVINNSVPGFYNPVNGNNWAGDNMSTSENFETCRAWAQAKNIPMFGFRNSTHPDARYRNTCWGYTGKQAFAGFPEDKVHVTACTDPTKLPATGCA